MMDLSADELPHLYTWIDGIPLSRPKRNIARDFSDGVLIAEVVAHYCPKLVDVHNYSAANGLAQKVYNWNTLNVKVFRRLHFSLTKEDIEAVASCESQMIERILKLLKYKIAKYKPQGLNGDILDGTQRPGDEGLSGGTLRSLGGQSLMRMAQQVQGKDPGYSREKQLATPSKMQASYEQLPTSRTASPRRSTTLPETRAKDFAEKDAHIRELGETIELLEAKVKKLEQLVRLKEHKIQVLVAKVPKSARP